MTTAAKRSKNKESKDAVQPTTPGGSPAIDETKAQKTEVAKAEAVMEETAPRRARGGDWAIAAALLLFFVGGFLLSLDWPFRAALFPRIITTAGALLAVVKLASLGLTTVRARSTGTAVVPSARAGDLPVPPQDASEEGANVRAAEVAAQSAPDVDSAEDSDGSSLDVQIVDDEQEDDESMEYVFASAGGRAWVAALGWIATFFVSFFVLGAFITVPLFAFVYLRFSGRASWWASALYAAVTGVLIFLVFRDVVFIPLPESVFPFLDF